MLRIFVVSVIAHGIANIHEAPLLLRRVAGMIEQIADFVFGACWSIWWPLAHQGMIWVNAAFTAERSFFVIHSISGALKNHAKASEEQRLRIRKEKAYAVWVRIVEKGNAPALEYQRAV
jgi:hypothetical protein